MLVSHVGVGSSSRQWKSISMNQHCLTMLPISGSWWPSHLGYCHTRMKGLDGILGCQCQPGLGLAGMNAWEEKYGKLLLCHFFCLCYSDLQSIHISFNMFYKIRKIIIPWYFYIQLTLSLKANSTLDLEAAPYFCKIWDSMFLLSLKHFTFFVLLSQFIFLWFLATNNLSLLELILTISDTLCCTMLNWAQCHFTSLRLFPIIILTSKSMDFKRIH